MSAALLTLEKLASAGGLALTGLMVTLACLVTATTARATLVDDFDRESSASPISRSLVGGRPLGGELDYRDDRSSLFAETGGAGILAKRPGRVGRAQLVYDGVDDSPDDAFGLGGVDITDLGAADAFAIQVSALVGIVTLRISVMESALDFASSSEIQIDRLEPLVVPFSSLLPVGAGAGAGADLTSVDQLVFDFSGLDSGDRVAIGSISTIPEPASAILLGLGLMTASRWRGQARE